jgi:ankyrin repeat protein
MNKVYDLHMTNEIRFHHLIDSDDEKGAIELLKQCGDSINVNYQYKNRIPVFSAINNRMYDLYDEIVNHPTFDCGMKDAFGETLLELLLYLRGSYDDDIKDSPFKVEEIERMIRTILNNERFDFNMTDINDDTAINIACEYPELLWVVEELAKKESVNPNIVNDFGRSALTNAIRHKNIEAVKILSKRNDITVRTIDLEEADKVGIDLADFGFETAIKLKKAHEYVMA